MTRIRLTVFAVLVPGLALLQGLAAARGPGQPPARPALRLRGRSISVAAPPISAAAADDLASTELTVTLTNTSPTSFAVSPSDFALSAQGDMFGVQGWNAGPSPVTIMPRHSDEFRLTFRAPSAAVEQAALVYRPGGERISGVVPLARSPRIPRATPSTAPPAIDTFPLLQGVGDPWGLALDKSGDIWFAEPGCDFAPTCPAGTPPGQIGELKAFSHVVVFYTLPNIPGNQPIFLAFDRSGDLWFTTPNNSKIGEFRPSAGKFIGQWAVTAGSGPWDLTFSNRTIWYTEHLVSAVGTFSPSTHRHRDYPTPSANSNPYGIAAEHGLIWFTENNSTVDRVAVFNTHKRRHAISEYQIVRPLSGTPHMIAIGPRGHPWWTEGFSNTIATLDPDSAKPGRCRTRSGTCKGVHRFPLTPATGCSTNGAHASGIAIQRSRDLVWLDNSLTAQVGSFDPRSHTFDLDTLSDCDDHPHDGLTLDSADKVWFDEEFGSAIGELTP